MKLILSLMMAALLTAGCTTIPSADPAFDHSYGSSSSLVSRVSKAADALASSLKSQDKGIAPVLVASAVSVDNITSSSTFGRAIGEQVAARLAAQGISVIELKLRNSVYISNSGGEFMLSREVKDLSTAHRAQVVVSSTYAIVGSQVIVTLKAVEVGNNRVLTGQTFSIARTEVGQ